MEKRFKAGRRKRRRRNILLFFMILLPVSVAGGVLIYSLIQGPSDFEDGGRRYAENGDNQERGVIGIDVYDIPESQNIAEAEESISEETGKEHENEASDTEGSSEEQEQNNDIPVIMERDTAREVVADRVSSTEILIAWNGIKDSGDIDGQYIIVRRGISEGTVSNQWEELAALPIKRTSETAAGAEDGTEYQYIFTDILTTSEPVQYEYRIDAESTDGTLYTGTEESTVVASNVLICIDPGHYKGSSTASDEKSMYGYEEGIFTLQVGLALREELAEHGINSYMTRETDAITIDGYTNSALDRGKISLRGEYAAGSNLFLSIHTNANKDNVNGCDTWHQPLEINKTLVIVNQPASRSEEAISIANGIGTAVTAASYRLGLSSTDQFEQCGTDSLTEWTDDFNDSINVKGTVCYRWGTDGDYYGVLRGAANVDVPGMIVEHGYHTVEEMRRQAMTEELAAEWAEADADGIVKGLGFQ